MIDLKKLIGSKIRKYRKKKNLTQEKLAEKAGLHLTFIAHIESGKKVCSINTLNKISQALNITIDKLFIPVEKIPRDVDVLTKKLINLLKNKPDIDKKLFTEIAQQIYKRNKILRK